MDGIFLFFFIELFQDVKNLTNTSMSTCDVAWLTNKSSLFRAVLTSFVKTTHPKSVSVAFSVENKIGFYCHLTIAEE